MKNIILLLILFLITNSFYAKEIQKLSKTEIPKTITYKGNFEIGYKWKDINGENYLILSSTQKIIEKVNTEIVDGNEYGKFIYAQQSVISNGNLKLLWNIKDYERNCPFDLDVSFIKESIKVTDIDSNGITETLIAYKLTCRSDISPSRMKILMHENQNKFGLRGYMRLLFPNQTLNENDIFEYNESKLSESQKKEMYYTESEGRYENELDFKNAPKAFLDFAKKNWKELSIEKL